VRTTATDRQATPASTDELEVAEPAAVEIERDPPPV